MENNSLNNTNLHIPFDEATQETQIQRLKIELLSVYNGLIGALRRIDNLEKKCEKLMEHEHGISGNVLVSPVKKSSFSGLEEISPHQTKKTLLD